MFRVGDHRTKSRPDSRWITALIKQYDDPPSYPLLIVYLNDVTIQTGDRLNIFNSSRLAGFSDGRTSYYLLKPTSIKLTEPVRYVAEFVGNSRRSVAALSEALTTKFSVSEVEARSALSRSFMTADS